VKNKSTIFNNLGHLIRADMLKEQYRLLNGKKAVGIDNVTKEVYGANLDDNINNLVKNIRHGTYKPKPGRVAEIPKEDGSKRPLVISCIEDKIVQLAVSVILNKIYEPLFLPCSYGYRPGKNCHDALRALNQAVYNYPSGAIIEIDIRKYFNKIPHKELMKILRKKISDRRFLRLIEILIIAPIKEGNKNKINSEGCPQGGLCEALHKPPYAK